jgi:dynein heavy chain
MESSFLLHLNALLQVRNKILLSMSVVEQHVLKTHISNVNEVFKRSLTLNWTSFRIAAFISSCSKSLEKMVTVLGDVRKHLFEVEEAVIAIEGMMFFEKNYYIGFSMLSVLEFVEIAEAKRRERVKGLVRKYLSIKPLLLKIEMIVEESDSGAAPSLRELYSYCEKRIYNALITAVIRSLNSLLMMLRSFQSSECTCRLDVRVKTDNSDSYAISSLQDIEKYMKDLIRSIPESCRQVTRWMHGSCLEVPPQLLSFGVCQEIFEYSFFTDVLRNSFVKNLIIEANEVILHDFSQ